MTNDPTPTVFIVDDDLAFLRAVSRLLRASGFQVVTHNSAAELLAELQPDTPGCCLLYTSDAADE